MNELIILDVAHGNTALLISKDVTAVFDAAPKDILLQTIALYEITVIDYLFLSHADKDHVGGVINLLASEKVNVKNLFINPDSKKKGIQNQALRIAIDDAVRRKGVRFNVISTGTPDFNIGEVVLHVVAPSIANILSGPGGIDSEGVSISSNSASSVLLLQHKQHSIALFAADMDRRCLDEIIKRESRLEADILIFPHHGGICADDNEAFVEKIINLVKPKLAIFSIGRGVFTNPRPEVIKTIKKNAANTCIMCTQLSTNCLKHLPDNRPEWQNHLNNLPGAGRTKDAFCSGSLRIFIDGKNTTYPDAIKHASFVRSNVPEALCLFS